MVDPVDRFDDASMDEGAGTASLGLVLGILGICLCVIVIGGLLSLGGLVAGVAHLRRSASERRTAAAGVAASTLGLLFSIMITWALVHAFDDLRQGMGAGGGVQQAAGTPLQPFQMMTLDGGSITLDDLRGRRVLVDVWATWCPPCRAAIPHLTRLDAETPDDDLLIVGISNESPKTVARFARQHGMRYPLVAGNSSAPEPFNQVTALPTVFVIDRSGSVEQVVVGYHDYAALRAMALGPTAGAASP